MDDNRADELIRAVSALYAETVKNRKATEALRAETVKNRAATEALLKHAAAPMYSEVDEVLGARQLSFLETLERIKDQRLSFARFGDGEFWMMQKLEYSIKFQRNSPQLQEALFGALHNAAQHQDRVLVGFPHVFRNVHWAGVLGEAWPMIRGVASEFEVLGDSHVSRPLAFEALGQAAVDAWRSLWEGKRVLIVTGQGSRFELNPALFDSLAGTDFAYTTPTNAFSSLPRITQNVKDFRPELVLISLGPAGSILAVGLALAGIQALDIGHLSSSYTNVMDGGLFPEEAPAVRV